MSGVILYPSTREDCDVGFLYIEVSGCLPMCGHGTIGTVTAAIEAGLVIPRIEGRLAIEAPAGRVEVAYRREGMHVEEVRLWNVPSDLHASDVRLEVAGMPPLTVDLAYGGNYYVIIEPQESWKGLDAISAGDILALSPDIRRAAQEKLMPVHPEDPRIRGVSHVMWCDRPKSPQAQGRNAVFYGERAIDRSPCGTGSSARMAQLVARGHLAIGDSFVHESIIGTLFSCRVESAARVGDFPGISPSIAGWARVTGHNTIFIDDRDPLAHGFQIR
jgi:proline racemase